MCFPHAGRTYRYWKGGEPLYAFGHGLSYAQFQLSDPAVVAGGADRSTYSGTPGGGVGAPVTASVTVTHAGGAGMGADHSLLLFLSYLGPQPSKVVGANAQQQQPAVTLTGSCTTGSTRTDLVQQLVGFQRTGVLAPGASKRLTFSLQLGPAGSSDSSWAGFGDPEPPCGTYSLQFGTDPGTTALIVLQ